MFAGSLECIPKPFVLPNPKWDRLTSMRFGQADMEVDRAVVRQRVLVGNNFDINLPLQHISRRQRGINSIKPRSSLRVFVRHNRLVPLGEAFVTRE